MTDELPKLFSDFARDMISPATFEHDLLALCKATPGCAWEALALLDQHFRRGKIAPELQHSLRHRIERQALGIESYQIESPQPEQPRQPKAAVAPAIQIAPDADDEEPTIEIGVAVAPTPPCAPAPAPAPAPAASASVGARPQLRVARAIALIAVLLAVAASPTVREGQEHRLAIGAGTADAGEALASRGASGAAAAGGAGTGQHDQTPEMLSLSSDRYIVDPDSDVAELLVERSADVSGSTSFLWWTEGSGAKPNEDYVAGKPRRVQLAGGIGSSALRIPILANPNRRHVEMFYVLIGRPEGNAGIGPIHRAAVFLLPRREP
jgi:hypothetical protein